MDKLWIIKWGDSLITRIEISGFKGFVDFSLDLNQFQVIVGHNAAGKSNLFDALMLLSKLAEKDIRSAFQEVRGESGELFTILPDGSTSKSMKFAVELLLEPRVKDQWGQEGDIYHPRVRYELHISRTLVESRFDKLKIEHEQLTPIMRKDDQWGQKNKSAKWANYFQYGRKKPFLSCQLSDNIPTLILHQDGRSGRQRKSPLDKLESSFLSSLTNVEFPHGFAVREELRNWTFLQLIPDSLRTPESRLAPSKMEASGKYLTNMMARLKKEDEFVLHDISKDISNLVPGIVRVGVDEDETRDRYSIWAQTNDGRTFSSRVLSDGTLRMLALTTIKNDSGHEGVLLFEEPENGVHPYRIKKLVPLLRQMTTDFNEEHAPDQKLRQLIINTHSPKFVSYLWDEEIIFAHVVDYVSMDFPKPLRVTRMVPVKNELIMTEDDNFYTRNEMEKYLESSDLEEAVTRLRGEDQ